MSETLYKITGPFGQAIHRGTWTYDLPTPGEDGTVTPGAWTPTRATDLCFAGWHVTTDPTQWLRIGCRAWVAEARGLSVETAGNKRVAASIRLMREAPEVIPSWWREVEVFVASIAAAPWFGPQRAADPAWRVFETRAAARDAAWNAARDAARDAAGDAAWAAARDAAWDAARNAARNAAGAAAGAAAGDAALMAQVLVCDGLPLDPRHVAHARDRWSVWAAGYGLAGEMDGVLHVYRRLT